MVRESGRHIRFSITDIFTFGLFDWEGQGMKTYTIKPPEWRDKSNAGKTEFDAFNLFGYYAAYENSDKDGYLSDCQYKAHTLRPHEFLTEEFSSQQEAKEWCEAQYEKHVAEYLVEAAK